MILIDEIDNGLHYSAYKKLWEAIFALAADTNKQVFVTTHSKETLYHLNEMLEEHSEYQDALRLYTIANTPKNGHQAYKYTYDGLTDNNKERVHVIYNGDYMDSIRIDLFFSDDNMYVSLRCWDIIHYSDADFAKVLRVCNKINSNYKYTTFYADESDNTISASIDIILLEDVDCSEITRENMLRLVNIVDENYELLAPYDA